MTLFNRITFYSCMVTSAILMIIGHYAVMASGAWFDPVNYEKYNIMTRWVSDFAAKSPQGLWIKGAIVVFCIAVYILIRVKTKSIPESKLGHLHIFLYSLLGVAIISGLLLVVTYDMSPPQYTMNKPSWLAELFGEKPSPHRIPKGAKDWIVEGHHKAGFLIFIVGFFAIVLTGLVEKWNARATKALRFDLIVLLILVAATVWLFAVKDLIAGVPQRVLLVAIFFWIWNEGGRLGEIGNRQLPDCKA